MKSNKAIATQSVKKLRKLLDSCSSPINRANLLSHIQSNIRQELGLTLDQHQAHTGGEGVSRDETTVNGIESKPLAINPKCESKPLGNNPKCELSVASNDTVTSGIGSTVVYTVECGEGGVGVAPVVEDAYKAKEMASVEVVGGGSEPVIATVFRACPNPKLTECMIGAKRVSVFNGGKVLRRGERVRVIRHGGTDGAPLYRLLPLDRV